MSSKRALILSGTPRRNGNTLWLTSHVVDNIHNRGIETKIVSVISLKSINNGCTGCQACQRAREYLCVFKDDVQPVIAAMPSYDYLIFATPVYFFGPTAQLKLVIDRMFSLIKLREDGTYIHPFSKRTKLGLIVTAGGDENDGCDLTLDMFRRTANIIGMTLETLVMPFAPFFPEEIEDPDTYRRQADAFCDRLLAS